MGMTAECKGLHSDCVVDGYEGDVGKVTLAEPEEDGGSGKGMNPMEALLTSFAVCEFEQSLMIAKEEGVQSWVLDIEASVTVNLDGYMNKPGAQKMASKDVFKAVS